MNETINTIFARRSIRKYEEKPVEKEKIEWLLKAGFAAPSAKDSRPYEFIVVTEKAQMDKIREGLTYGNYNAPAAIIVCANKTVAAERVKGEMWPQDCSAAIQNVMVAAVSINLGTVWLGVYPISERVTKVTEILEIPAHVTPLGIVYVGYKAEQKEPRHRYDESKVHWEKYCLK